MKNVIGGKVGKVRDWSRGVRGVTNREDSERTPLFIYFGWERIQESLRGKVQLAVGHVMRLEAGEKTRAEDQDLGVKSCSVQLAQTTGFFAFSAS